MARSDNNWPVTKIEAINSKTAATPGRAPKTRVDCLSPAICSTLRTNHRVNILAPKQGTLAGKRKAEGGKTLPEGNYDFHGNACAPTIVRQRQFIGKRSKHNPVSEIPCVVTKIKPSPFNSDLNRRKSCLHETRTVIESLGGRCYRTGREWRGQDADSGQPLRTLGLCCATVIVWGGGGGGGAGVTRDLCDGAVRAHARCKRGRVSTVTRTAGPKRPPPAMLHSLNALAGKISPGGGLDTNANRHTHPNRNHGHKAASPSSPYTKPNGMTMNINNNNNNNSINNNINNNDEKSEMPDPDYIKMFVGQVPRSMDENDLRQMFEEFGRVHQINVLRDKITGASKGCCFVTFFTRKAALKAQDALHNIKTLSGMHHPIQMKPADSENRNALRFEELNFAPRKPTRAERV
ncbi:unnamed protein product, partial [Iphiclides podalirius]